jgi:hypothetical protein
VFPRFPFPGSLNHPLDQDHIQDSLTRDKLTGALTRESRPLTPKTSSIGFLRDVAYQARPGLREIHQCAESEDVHVHGSGDDYIERLEFYKEYTLLSYGSL